MTALHWLILAALAALCLASCASLEVTTPYGRASYDGKAIRLSYSPK